MSKTCPHVSLYGVGYIRESKNFTNKVQPHISEDIIISKGFNFNLFRIFWDIIKSQNKLTSIYMEINPRSGGGGGHSPLNYIRVLIIIEGMITKIKLVLRILLFVITLRGGGGGEV